LEKVAQHDYFQHLVIDFVRALQAFVFQVHTIGVDAYYSQLSSPLELAKMTLYVTQTILADGVMVNTSI